jgi:hypothetical protein
MNKYVDWILTIIISAIVGALVGLPVIIILANHVDTASLIKSGIAGLTIGILSRSMFLSVYKNIRKKPALSFFIVFTIIFIGTFSFSYLFGIRNIYYIILMVTFAELIGLAITFFYFRYLIKLNKKLESIQKKLSE